MKFSLMFILSLLFLSFPVLMSQNFSSSLQKFFSIMMDGVFNLFPKLDFKSSGLMHFILSMFFFLSMINFISLFSYIFSPLTHVSLTIMMSLLMWISTMMYQIFFFLKNKISHLLPKGTPTWLIFIMVLIELISQLIRPITLGVRLAANLTAGHLILSLLAFPNIFYSFFSQFPLFLLEIMVSFVQPFVFCLLVFLYFSEA